MSSYRGINNRNPLNCKTNGANEWAGCVGVDELGHCVFAHEMYSVRAACRNLAQYQKWGANTLAKIFAIYAPSDDPNAHNQPNDYAAFVAARVGHAADSFFSLFSDPGGHVLDPSLLADVINAMIEFENFSGLRYPQETIISGIIMYEKDFVT